MSSSIIFKIWLDIETGWQWAYPIKTIETTEEVMMSFCGECLVDLYRQKWYALQSLRPNKYANISPKNKNFGSASSGKN
ncbi:hypothetical protein L0B70_04375 [Kaistella sp. 97-N-M2]|uniref:hypothetical protein n=1 Tax=Kaistella sp. 97-N-M2 TaxID=2908645 RepID=UPI001F1D8134|nr:hypothetical protein [Kaistella sp. 97-N-M2]UJF30627.1 hypothetical protein L0B70_04375 [Kaistella sp. 97-N-M2]